MSLFPNEVSKVNEVIDLLHQEHHWLDMDLIYSDVDEEEVRHRMDMIVKAINTLREIQKPLTY